jgi:hypothetical protein
LMLIVMSMLVNYFFALWLKNKTIREQSPLVFTCLLVGLYVIFLQLPSQEYKIVSMKKKWFEDFNVLLVSDIVRFEFVENSSCLSTMYYPLLII